MFFDRFNFVGLVKLRRTSCIIPKGDCIKVYALNKMQLLAMLWGYKNSIIIRATTENVGKKKK